MDGRHEAMDSNKKDVKLVDGRMCITLKIPKSGCEGTPPPPPPPPNPRRREEAEQLQQSQIRICGECNKEFSSGKALGGHMRIHVQAHHHKLHLLEKMKSAVDEDDPDPDPDHGGKRNESHACGVCGKDFRSEKSLFGHMRCHPDRPWRGIHPPPHYDPSPAASAAPEPIHKNSSSSTLSSDALGFHSNRHHHQRATDQDQQIIDSAATTDTVTAATDLSQALRGHMRWLETNRRGRKKEIATTSSGAAAAVPAADPSVSSFRELELESEAEQRAVLDLMWLAHSHPRHQHQECASSEKRIRPLSVDRDQNRSEVPQEQQQFKRRKMKKKRKVRELGAAIASIRDVAAVPDKFKCSSCGKSFATHQALGGHRSSHNKPRHHLKNSANTSVRHPRASAEEALPALMDDKISDHLDGGTDGCRWESSAAEFDAAAAAAPFSTASSAEGSNGHGGGEVGLNIDLNELPLLEDDGM